jgi:hypothetical protein
VQQVPVHNSSDVDWLLTVIPRPLPPFNGPPNLKVPAKGSAMYPITYAPVLPTVTTSTTTTAAATGIGGVSSGSVLTEEPLQTVTAATVTDLTVAGDVLKLCLNDTRSLEQPINLEFVLRGTAEEPLAEEHRIVDCSARQNCTQKFLVKNPSAKEVTFSVVTGNTMLLLT